MKPHEQQAQEILLQAMASQHGVAVETTNAELARARLYRMRKQLADPAMDCLQFHTAPDGTGQIWIVKGGVSDAKD